MDSDRDLILLGYIKQIACRFIVLNKLAYVYLWLG